MAAQRFPRAAFICDIQTETLPKYLAMLRKIRHRNKMAIATKTIKLPFLRLNKAKALDFKRLEKLNTEVANSILARSKSERRTLTTKAFAHIEIGSAWINQTIRNANAKTKVKHFKSLPLETNNQNWTLHKNGETFSVSFGLVRGVKKRIPLEVHHASHGEWLQALLDGKAKAGSIKLWQSRKGIWYALLSVSMDVPDAKVTGRWVGIDRGQNVPAVAATPDGQIIFYKAAKIRHVRRVYAKRRAILQAAGKHRAVKKLSDKERRIVTQINHVISKDIVALAKRYDAGIRIEDLSGIRKSKQWKKTKSDAGNNRDFWPFFQLETFVRYKSALDATAVEDIAAPYTSQTCNCCAHLNKRKKHAYHCGNCNRKAHADGNAAQNIRDWIGLHCLVNLKALPGGPDDMALNIVSNHTLAGAGARI